MTETTFDFKPVQLDDTVVEALEAAQQREAQKSVKQIAEEIRKERLRLRALSRKSR